ncbi:MAG: ankyrin repeat domain-containing protein [Oligoflexia bacterium]|nr:ankyrin repeat domain-containing protein [Oligoflexia bacterium]
MEILVLAANGKIKEMRKKIKALPGKDCTKKTMYDADSKCWYLWARDGRGYSAPVYAVQNNLAATMQELARQGFLLNHVNAAHALYEAAKTSNEPMSQILLDNGADKDAAFMIAVKSGDPVAIQYLLSKGANVNYVGHGENALMLAGRYGNFNTVTYLLEKGSSRENIRAAYHRLKNRKYCKAAWRDYNEARSEIKKHLSKK